MELSDYDVIKLCLNGDQDAYAELINRYKRLIYTIIYRMLNDREEAADVAQEVFIKIYRSLDRYDPSYKFSTWASKIAVNLCLDLLRKKKLETISVEEGIAVPDSQGTPEDRYLKKERRREIEEAIQSLPEKYKLPIILFHQNGLAYSEISTVLNEPLSIVKNRLHRARHMLKDKLMSMKKEQIL